MIQTAQKQVQQSFATHAKPTLSVVPNVDSVVELFYVHLAVPVVGSRIGPRGECAFDLIGAPIDGRMTPAQVRGMVIAPEAVQTRRYHGFISEVKGDKGMVSGYIWAFKDGVPMDTVAMPAPKMARGWQPQGDVMAEIDMVKRIAAKRHPAPMARNPKCVCGG